MVELLGHRQSKEAATDKRHLIPPRHLSTLLVRSHDLNRLLDEPGPRAPEGAHGKYLF